MRTNNNDLHQSPTQFIYLTKKGRKTTKQPTIEIGFVEYNKRYYILSEHKKASYWVQNIISDRNVSFKINNTISKGYTRIIDKNKKQILSNTVSVLVFQKYGWTDGLIVELTSKDNNIK